jgi:hypothetical protein
VVRGQRRLFLTAGIPVDRSVVERGLSGAHTHAAIRVDYTKGQEQRRRQRWSTQSVPQERDAINAAAPRKQETWNAAILVRDVRQRPGEIAVLGRCVSNQPRRHTAAYGDIKGSIAAKAAKIVSRLTVTPAGDYLCKHHGR